jgi:hypothetical protein
MEEKELSERLTNTAPATVELPEHRRQLKRALLTYAQARKETHEEQAFSIFSRLTWQRLAAGFLVLVLVATLALSWNSLTGQSDKLHGQ